MAGTGGYENVILPSAFGGELGQAIQGGLQRQQQQQDKLLSMSNMIWNKQQQRRQENLRQLNQDTDFDQYKTGEQKIDDYSIGELNKVKNYALSNLMNLDPAEMEYRLQGMLNPIFKWHQQAKGAYTQGQQMLDDFNKTYPNADLGKARAVFENALTNDFLNPDGTRKNPDQIKVSDYGSLLQHPDVLGAITNDTTPFTEFFQKMPKEEIARNNYTNNQGRVQDFKWSGFMPLGDVGEVRTDNEGKPTEIGLRGTTINSVADANGQPMKMVPEPLYQQMMADPKVRAASLGMWQPMKQKIEDNYTQQTGQKITPDIENMLFKSFLYNEGDRLLKHPVKETEIQKTPKPPTVNISLGNTQIHDVYKEVSDIANRPDKPHGVPLNELSADTQKELIDYANKLKPHDYGGTELGQKDIFIRKEPDGKIWLIGYPNNEKIAPLNYTDLNLPANKGAKPTQKVLMQGAQQSIGKKKIEGF